MDSFSVLLIYLGYANLVYAGNDFTSLSANFIHKEFAAGVSQTVPLITNSFSCTAQCIRSKWCLGFTFNLTSCRCELHGGCIKEVNSTNLSGGQIDSMVIPDRQASISSDLAIGKPVSASSSYNGMIPERAVDGLTDETNDPHFCSSYAVLGDTEKWFMVDLQTEHCIHGVNLLYKYPILFPGGSVRVIASSQAADIVSDNVSVCSEDSGEVALPWQYLTCNQPITGRFVKVLPLYDFVYGTGDQTNLCLIELQVVGNCYPNLCRSFTKIHQAKSSMHQD